MDAAIHPGDQKKIVEILVPGKWTVQRGHDLLEAIESELHEALPRALVTTHLEPVEDPAAWESTILEKQGKPET